MTKNESNDNNGYKHNNDNNNDDESFCKEQKNIQIYSDTRPTSPSADPIMTDTRHSSHWRDNVCWLVFFVCLFVCFFLHSPAISLGFTTLGEIFAYVTVF